jgi:hypothetical protein
VTARRLRAKPLHRAHICVRKDGWSSPRLEADRAGGCGEHSVSCLASAGLTLLCAPSTCAPDTRRTNPIAINIRRRCRTCQGRRAESRSVVRRRIKGSTRAVIRRLASLASSPCNGPGRLSSRHHGPNSEQLRFLAISLATLSTCVFQRKPEKARISVHRPGNCKTHFSDIARPESAQTSSRYARRADR